MSVLQENIDATIELLYGEMFHWLYSASVQDSFGNWDKAKCFLDRAETVSQKIGVLETNCEIDIEEFINKNASTAQCDINSDRGIGEWAIAPSGRGCNVFKIRGGITPPPYGEFVKGEFVIEHFTEERTS